MSDTPKKPKIVFPPNWKNVTDRYLGKTIVIVGAGAQPKPAPKPEPDKEPVP